MEPMIIKNKFNKKLQTAVVYIAENNFFKRE